LELTVSQQLRKVTILGFYAFHPALAYLTELLNPAINQKRRQILKKTLPAYQKTGSGALFKEFLTCSNTRAVGRIMQGANCEAR
jgi:hypothetical protein